MLRDAAIHWVEANCPVPKLRADFVRQLDDALQDEVNCWFVIGREMTRHRVATLIHCFAGELFIFQLTDAQAISLGTSAKSLGFSRDPHPLSRRPANPPLVSLSNFELDRSMLLGHDPITGSCRYERTGALPAAFCLRLDYSLGKLGNLISWNYPEQLLTSSGSFRVSFSPLAVVAPPRVQAYRGPVMMFLRLCTLPFSGDDTMREPISNACGALAEFTAKP